MEKEIMDALKHGVDEDYKRSLRGNQIVKEN